MSTDDESIYERTMRLARDVMATAERRAGERLDMAETAADAIVADAERRAAALLADARAATDAPPTVGDAPATVPGDAPPGRDGPVAAVALSPGAAVAALAAVFPGTADERRYSARLIALPMVAAGATREAIAAELEWQLGPEDVQELLASVVGDGLR